MNMIDTFKTERQKKVEAVRRKAARRYQYYRKVIGDEAPVSNNRIFEKISKEMGMTKEFVRRSCISLGVV